MGGYGGLPVGYGATPYGGALGGGAEGFVGSIGYGRDPSLDKGGFSTPAE